MDRLEQYIKDNRSSFDTELLPSGSRERFMARLEAENKERKGDTCKLPWHNVT